MNGYCIVWGGGVGCERKDSEFNVLTQEVPKVHVVHIVFVQDCRSTHSITDWTNPICSYNSMTRFTNTILSPSIPNPQYKKFLNGHPTLTLPLITPTALPLRIMVLWPNLLKESLNFKATSVLERVREGSVSCQSTMLILTRTPQKI